MPEEKAICVKKGIKTNKKRCKDCPDRDEKCEIKKVQKGGKDNVQ